MRKGIRFVIGIIGCILLFGLGVYQLSFGSEGSYSEWFAWFCVIGAPISALGMYRNYKLATS
ncbi:hypothetical protein N780_06005 [Pontibacillus chungwhensis BH030062]|uniref:Uncharacterized protein n=1 Tax=Pontibacillus chungwhensis BH030062 TaxID=1385513 RepID=A0A0A2UPU7_9BACI|nr:MULTISPECIES: hypothetical protein [Pontibacillus]KGP90302.1 hypothetical protein N780_06005 [Pontibacillus chungwhensis BH030062]QST00905.1 hypothetical protein IMZ31_04865 [Pontibacillus sp. ALD_SL1]